MHETLFTYPAILARYRAEPLLAERERFLRHCAEQGYTRSGLQKIAWSLRIIAKSSIVRQRRVRRVDLARLVSAHRPSTRALLVDFATRWFSLMGQPELEVPPESPFAAQINAFEHFVRHEHGLSELTIVMRRYQLSRFLRMLQRANQLRSLSDITPRHIDRYLIEASQRGWSRRTLSTAASTLRSFFHYAAVQHWCQSGLAAAIDSPRLYAQEGVPRGPEWAQVQALIASIRGHDPVSIRDRAVVMLLALYGLRRSEVAGLRLEDLDWQNELIRITRSKQRRIQQYPLMAPVGDALVRYLQHARPRCDCRRVFLAIKPPIRALSEDSISAIVRRRLRAIGVNGIPCGSHSLRHAFARHLLAKGFSFKQIGDQLGHRRAATTSIYAKVDLKGLRQVAELSLGRLA
jgi:site-specific recombinase XerD